MSLAPFGGYRAPPISRSRRHAMRTCMIFLGILLVMAFPPSRKIILSPVRDTAAATSAAADYTGTPGPGRTGWAVAVLHGAGVATTAPAVDAMVVWELSEGGGFGNQASFNPLNLNPGTASWPGHPVNGAWAFPDAADGINETIDYLHYSNYTRVLAAFRAGTSEHAILAAIVASPWAGSHYAGNAEMQYALAHTTAARTGPPARAGLTLAA